MALNKLASIVCLCTACLASAARSRRRQLVMSVALAVGVVSAFAAEKIVNGAAPAAPQSAIGRAPAPAPPGTFRPSAAQWKSLKLETVRSMLFESECVTDGEIALNDDRTTPVFSPYSGRVSKLFAQAGDKVKKGAPLLAVAASEFVQAQTDLISAVAALRTARVQVDLARRIEQRQHDLYLAQAGARKDWEQSMADLVGARGTLQAAEMTRAAVRNRLRILGETTAEIVALENSPSTHQSTPEALVRAPIAGTVIQRQVGLGQYIVSSAGGGSNPQYTISNLATVWLIANVRETDAPVMRIGLPVDVHVLAYPGRTFHARITWIAAAIDSTTHRLPVRGEISNPDGALKPMMFASVDIIASGGRAAPGVPESAIVHEGDAAHVFVARADGTLALRPIRTGRITQGMVEVTAGLAPGEKLVTSGTLFIDRAAQGE